MIYKSFMLCSKTGSDGESYKYHMGPGTYRHFAMKANGE